ncbi:MAG: sugar ABC transporter permease [Rhodobacterales bacterium]|nr:MAG: sugar ABC transporter permease [Rhodobacterales bacterium]
MSFSASGLHARKFKTPRTIIALILREMVTTYGRSPGGYLWAILEPVGGLAVLTIAFSMAFHNPALGNSFPLFYATGYLPFMAYSDLAQKIGQSIRFSRPLLAYPSVTYTDAIIARFLLNTLTHLMVFFLIISGIMLMSETRAVLDYGAIANSFGMALTLGLGLGTLNCFLLMRFPIWERLWVILNRPLFLMSGVFFMYEFVPDPFGSYLWYNPLIHVVGEMRRGFYPTYSGDYISYVYAYGLGLIFLLMGNVLLGRYHRELLSNW